MSRQRDLDQLLWDLRSFLLLLDRESLSAAARAKKRSVSALLARLQRPPPEDAEYMIMRCLSPSPVTPTGRCSPGSGSAEAAGGGGRERPHGANKEPGVPPTLPADDSYEDTEPPEHGGGDSDSSHYESYGEEEEEEEEDGGVTDRAHYLRWPAGTSAEPPEPPGRPEAQLCGFLWRKRWLGRWAKQLFIVREHVLLCFRCAADLQPLLQLDLRGCRVSCKDKRGKKMPHALKVAGRAGEVLVIGFQSRQQAEDWRKVIEEVSSDGPSGLAALGVPAPPSSRPGRIRGSPYPHSGPASPQLGKEEEEEGRKRCRPSPARRGEDGKGGFPVLRQRLRAALRRGALRVLAVPGAAPRPEGCRGSPGTAAGSPQNLRARIAQRGRELARLQARPDQGSEARLRTPQTRGAAEPKKGEGPPPRPPRPSSRPAAGGLLLRRVPTPNAYMDDPSGHPPPAGTPKHLSCSAERLQQLQSLERAVPGQRPRPVSALPGCASAAGGARASPAGHRAFPKPEEHTGQLLRGAKGRMRSGSEINLLALGTALRGHIAASASSAGSEGSFLRPLLKRSSSARSALRPPPSPLTAGKGNVMRKKKEWEMKSAM
nr:actin filament-associated protein 1-like 1 isoform X5 [Taeniopygia guttata]